MHFFSESHNGVIKNVQVKKIIFKLKMYYVVFKLFPHFQEEKWKYELKHMTR